MTSLHRLTAIEMLAGYSSRRFSSTSVIEAVMAVARSRGTALGAIVALADKVAEIAPIGTGKDTRVLSGIPVSLKDDLFAAGMPATGGSRAFAENRPIQDSVAVARLRNAGALLFGKTNLSELAMTVESGSPLFGICANPWDLLRSAGASSCGAAAAVAAGIGPIAFATDSGGSIRYPASLCGVIGFAPSNGRVPRFGNLGSNQSFCSVGVLARCCEDVALGLHVVSGPDASDPATAAYPSRISATVTRERARGLRVGWMKEEGATADAAEAACHQIGAAFGWEVQPFTWPLAPDIQDFQAISDCDRYALLIESGQLDRALLGEISEPARVRLEKAQCISGVRYASAIEKRRRFIQSLSKLFEQFDLIAGATSPHVAPLLGADATDFGRKALSRLWWTNYSGCCAASVPAGLWQSLPVGLHLVARPGNDDLLLAACAEAESLFPVVMPPGTV